MVTNKRAVSLLSGGMDSVTLAYYLKSQGYELTLLSFDYGQRHKKELQSAALIAELLGAKWSLINLTSLTHLIATSSLTNKNIEVPEGHYSDETMRITVVPNRNAMMLSIAWAVAIAQGAEIVAFGAHNGDSAIYPDCRPEFTRYLNSALQSGNKGFMGEHGLRISSPFINMSKAEIATTGHDLRVPYELTWSCYKGGNVHCGKCATCVERKEAFELAGLMDFTTYEEAE